MINALWIPPQNPVTVVRLVIWFFLANIAFKEGWNDMKTWNTYERQFNPVEARYRWLAFGVLAMEAAIPFKFVRKAGNLVENPEHPVFLIMIWAVVIVTMLAFYIRLRSAPWRTKKFLKDPPQVKHEEPTESND